MTDWTLIAGGRCSKQPWYVGIVGFDPEEQQMFLLSETDWFDLERQLPLEPLAIYGRSNGLLFEHVTDAQSFSCDGLLLIAHTRREQPVFHPASKLRRYLLLYNPTQRAALADETVFAKLFVPADVPLFGERVIYLNSQILTDPSSTDPGEWAIAREPNERDYSRLYSRSADFWIHSLTSAIAADAAAVCRVEPLLSVIIPSYNHGRFLEQCIQSVLDEGEDDIEILVLDNASTDETPEVMASFQDEPRVRYMRNRYNYGPGFNWRNGLWLAQGRYFTFLSADDYFNPGHLSRLLPTLERHPHVAVGYTGIRWVDGQGQALSQPRHPGYRNADYVGGRNEVSDLLIYDCYMTPSAVIHRRAAFCKTWRPGKTHGAGDWEMVVQMAEQYPDFAYADTPGVSYRWHGAQESSSFYASTEPLEGHLAIVEGVFQRNAHHHLKGREREVAAHIERRLSGYPDEQHSPLGERARVLIARLAELARFNEAPLFSIILTTYNRPEMLRDALTSIDSQSWRDFEVILVNDHGEPVEQLLQAFDFPISYLYQGRNRGPAAARNAALHLARGRYVVYLDDDDRYLANHLQALAQAVESHPGTVVYVDAIFVIEALEDGQRLERYREMRYLHDEYSRERLLVSNYIPINTFACPRELVAAAGGFDEALQGLEDWDFLMRLAGHADFHHVHERTVEVRLREAEVDPERRSEQVLKSYPELYRVLYLRHLDLGSDEVREGRREQLRRFGLAGGQHAGSSSMQEWLQQRTLSPVQRDLVEQHLQQTGQAPSIGVLILDRHGNPGQVSKTLESLRMPRENMANVHALVLTITPTGNKTLPEWVTVVPFDDWVATLNQLLRDTSFDWITLAGAGDEFTASGLLMVSLELLTAPECRAVYCDVMYRQADGALGAAFRPDFNLDYLLSFPAGMAKHWLFRRDVLIDAGGFDSAYKDALEFELILRLINRSGLAGLGHIAEPLLITDPPAMVDIADEQRAIALHLEVRGYQGATVGSSRPGRYRIEYGHPDQPLVSILIACGEQLPRVQRCVESLLETTRYPNYELLLIDSHPEAQAVGEWLGALEGLGEARLRIVRPALKASTLALTLNQAAEHAVGDYLLLLSAGSAIIGADWLDGLINHAQRPEVGVVGAKLLSAEGEVRQAGLLLGLSGPVGRPFVGEPLDAAGYMQRLQVDQNYSAVSLDCLMIGRGLYKELGGLDERSIAACYADADLCLKAQEAGYLTVWAADVQVMQGGDEPSAASLDEQDAMYAKWLPKLARDPAYNANLSLVEPGGFKLADNKLSWRPLAAWRPLPTVLAHPADLAGCGQYRVIQPFNALQQQGLIEGALSFGMLSVVDLERYDPDVVLLQRQIGDERLEAMRRMQAFSRALKVYELDDYLPNLPMKSAYRAHMPKDILRSLRRGISYADRFVVSTEAMAEAFQDFHPDIRIVKNRLDPSQWSGLTSQRRSSSKPRVGWAGGVGHAGDLEMLADVVKALTNEVEWVFFGMCPDGLRPFIHEFHPGVPIEQYPAALAGLNLDLALAPVEQNLFNECKSNLRLLEYGACGYPVICSDVRCYQDGLPVTRVKNRFKDWLDAIRMFLADLDAAARMGDELRAAVTREWMLEGHSLEAWRKAWLPD